MGQKVGDEFGYYFSICCDENWVRIFGIDFQDCFFVFWFFRIIFSDWNFVWEEMIENVSEFFIFCFIYCMFFDQDWKMQDNLIMMGDVVYVMLLFVGEGVNMVMFDVLELS